MFLLITVSVCAGETSQDLSTFATFLSQLVPLLSTQLLDLRSAIMKESCVTINALASSLDEQFESQMSKYINGAVLLKPLNSGNKLIAETANQCIVNLLSTVQSHRVIPKLHEEAKSKNALVRTRIVHYFFIILSNYPLALLEKHMHVVEDFVAAALKDACAEARSRARKCFYALKEIMPHRAAHLFNLFDVHTQKAIRDEDAGGPPVSDPVGPPPRSGKTGKGSSSKPPQPRREGSHRGRDKQGTATGHAGVKPKVLAS